MRTHHLLFVFYQAVLEDGKGSFIETWIREAMVEKGVIKSTIINRYSNSQENTMVDNLLQQLSSGELRTQVLCVDMPTITPDSFY